jgi:hypothetical protein
VAALAGLLILASPVFGVLTFIAAVALGGVAFESDGPRSSAQYLAWLILVAWAALSYVASRHVGFGRPAAAVAACLAAAWAIGSLALIAAFT